MKKNLFAFLFCLCGVLLAGYDSPEFLYSLNMEVYLQPKEIGKEVFFSFAKKDRNGRPGKDGLSFAITAPSGAVVYSGTLPDDGNDSNNWKSGPHQEAVCRFVAKERGIHTLSFMMSGDYNIHFKNTQVENAYWAVGHKRFRTETKNAKFHCWFTLPVCTPGEGQNVDFSSNYMHYSRIVNLQVKGLDGTLYFNQWNLPAAPDRKHIFPCTLTFQRKRADEIYELTADEFNIISFEPQKYPSLIFFFDKESAEFFKDSLYPRKLLQNRTLVELAAGKRGIALPAGMNYRISYCPAQDKSYPAQGVTLSAYGKQGVLKDGNSFLEIEIPRKSPFGTLTSNLPDAQGGMWQIDRICSDRPEVVSPVAGSVLDGKGEIALQTLAVKGATDYRFELMDEQGKSRILESRSSLLTLQAGMLSAGVWKIRSCAQGKNWGNWSCFSVKSTTDTMPIYAYGWRPVSDGRVDKVDELSFCCGEEVYGVDFSKSYFLVNGKKIGLSLISTERVGVQGVSLTPGKVDVQLHLYDLAGNYSQYEWCFFYRVPAVKTISFDANGYLLFNGRHYYPQILYPPTNNPAENLGFNATLPNTLAAIPTLDLLLKKNMKTLDSGCVYHGYYTAKGSTPLQDVQNYMNGPGSTHPARLGAWLDEPDAHIPDSELDKHMKAYRPDGDDNKGVAMVCCTSRTRYGDMAKKGSVLMVDIYPLADMKVLDQTLAKAIQEAAGKPIWQLNQGFDYNETVTREEDYIPTNAHLKYAHWSVFRHGIQGLGLYGCGSKRVQSFPSRWKCTVENYRQSATLGFALMTPSLKNICEMPQELKYRAMKVGKRLYLLVQNTDEVNGVAALLKVKKGKYLPQVRVLFENRVLQQKNGVFQDSFTPIESRIYELEEAN